MLLTVSTYLVPLIITILAEAFTLLLYKETRPIIYLIQVLMNIFTNLGLNFILVGFSNVNFDTLILIILEIVVFIIEGVIYSFYYKNILIGFILSFCCNIMSYSFGIAFGDII